MGTAVYMTVCRLAVLMLLEQYISDHLDNRSNTRTGKRKRSAESATKPPKWMINHMDLRQSSRASERCEPLCYTSLDEKTLQEFPGLIALTDRQLDTLRLLRVKVPSRPPAADQCSIDTFLDVNMSATKADLTTMFVSCITERSIIYSTRRNRLLTGDAKLRLQGIIFSEGMDTALSTLSSSTKADLAGNAFQTHCCTASLLVILMTLAKFSSCN